MTGVRTLYAGKTVSCSLVNEPSLKATVQKIQLWVPISGPRVGVSNLGQQVSSICLIGNIEFDVED